MIFLIVGILALPYLLHQALHGKPEARRLAIIDLNGLKWFFIACLGGVAVKLIAVQLGW